MAEVGTAEVGMTEVGIAEIGTAEVGLVEVGLVEEGTAEVSIAEVGIAEVGYNMNIRMLFPPLVPCLHALFEQSKMLLVCHCVLPSFLIIFGHLTSVFDPDKGVLATLYAATLQYGTPAPFTPSSENGLQETKTLADITFASFGKR